MGMTHEDIQLDSNKSKALFMAVGWNASPVGALIYAMSSKHCALNSDKGYSVGQKYVGYVEHTKHLLQAADGAEAAALKRLDLIGRADDLLSTSRAAAPTSER